jgi:ribosomal protein S18 acetylase RimI-like enzyme
VIEKNVFIQNTVQVRKDLKAYRHLSYIAFIDTEVIILYCQKEEIGMITPASLNDLPEIIALVQAVIVEMNRSNIDQWDEVYPDEATIENDILTNSLYKYEIGGAIAAIITINNQGSPEYDEIPWSDTSNNFIVVHRLAVLPVYQGKGIAKSLMRFCEELAIKNNRSSIRLDAFTQNPIACNLYRQLEFNEKGSVQFRKGTFYCFEKLLRKRRQDGVT